MLPGVYQNHLLLFNFVIFLILAQGVNIIYGFTGYLPFGYVGFFGAGAYGFAILVMHYQTPAVLAVIVAGLVGVALGLLLTPLLRLSGAYFAIANLAASLAVLHFVANPALENITRGPYGVSLTVRARVLPLGLHVGPTHLDGIEFVSADPAVQNLFPSRLLSHSALPLLHNGNLESPVIIAHDDRYPVFSFLHKIDFLLVILHKLLPYIFIRHFIPGRIMSSPSGPRMAIMPFVSTIWAASTKAFTASSGDPNTFCFPSWAEQALSAGQPQPTRPQPLLKHIANCNASASY